MFVNMDLTYYYVRPKILNIFSIYIFFYYLIFFNIDRFETRSVYTSRTPTLFLFPARRELELLSK